MRHGNVWSTHAESGCSTESSRDPASAPAQFGAARQILRPSGIRLEGNAFIRRPELQVTADAIALDYSAASKAIRDVRARGKVFFRVNLPPRSGGARRSSKLVAMRLTSTPTRAR
jgi:hypothetical protein